jgi:nucleoside-diphosphate-sugar epimerase
MAPTALVVGITGIGGQNCAHALLDKGFDVVGLSRSVREPVPGVDHVLADVLDPESVERAVAGRPISHLVFTTWQRQATEAENCRVNGAMLRNTLEVLGRTTTLRRRRPSARAKGDCRSRTSTTSRRTHSSRQRLSRASRGRCTDRTR